MTVGAGLLVRSFWRLRRSIPASTRTASLAVQIEHQSARTTARPRSIAFMESARGRARAFPGVTNAAHAERACRSRDRRTRATSSRTVVPADGYGTEVGTPQRVAPSYFKTMKVPVMRGRCSPSRIASAAASGGDQRASREVVLREPGSDWPAHRLRQGAERRSRRGRRSSASSATSTVDARRRAADRDSQADRAGAVGHHDVPRRAHDARSRRTGAGDSRRSSTISIRRSRIISSRDDGPMCATHRWRAHAFSRRCCCVVRDRRTRAVGRRRLRRRSRSSPAIARARWAFVSRSDRRSRAVRWLVVRRGLGVTAAGLCIGGGGGAARDARHGEAALPNVRRTIR